MIDYKNWKFDIGDLVQIRRSGNLDSEVGIIVGRDIRSKHVEARPIRIVEFESYSIQSSSSERLVAIEGKFLSLVN